MAQAEARRRRGGRRGAAPPGAGDRYRRLVNPFEPPRVLDDDQVERIHQAALRVLADSGMRVLLPAAREAYASAGCAVDDDDLIVRFDPDRVGEALATAPAEFDLVPRNPERRVTMGGRHVALVPVGGPPHITDLDRGRRNGTLADFDDLVRLAQHFDVLHVFGPGVEPQDVPLEARHLQTTRSMVTLGDKVPFVYSRGRGQVADCFEVLRITHGAGEDEFAAAARCYTVINTNSPRQLDVPMCLGLMQFAEAMQVAVVTPFTLAGAMAPVTLAGALTLQHAEALGAITLSQIVRPGAPVVYGAFTSNVDMRSGAPAFGTPEAVKAAWASGQLARHIGLPWRSSGVSTSNTPDAQAGYETMMNMMGAALGGANMIIHAAGWLESGLAASPEKFVLDAEMCQMFAELFTAVSTSDEDVGVDAIAAVPPGGHFFGTEHTLARYATAFYEPVVFTRQNFEQWVEAGSPDAARRANAVWKRIVAEFEPPPLDDAVRAELDDYVARRTAAGGALPES